MLGIDFGTSNTVAVLAGGGRPPRLLSIDGSAWMPSAVYVNDDDTLLLTGGPPQADPSASTTTTNPTAVFTPGIGPASAAVPQVPATCATAPVEADSGMTPCMLAVAGPVRQQAMACTSADSSGDISALIKQYNAVAVSACAVSGKDAKLIGVVYIQLPSAEDRDKLLTSVTESTNGTASSWSQGGQTGKYATGKDADSGEPSIVWSYSSIPVLAVVEPSTPTGSPTSGMTLDELKTYWGTLLPVR